MKTETKSLLLKFLESQGQARPRDIAKHFRMSTQAIHRHLKTLVSEGLLEQKSKPPTTYYTPADTPIFSLAAKWMRISKVNSTKFKDFVCETRDVFTARLSRFKNFVAEGLPERDLPLIVAVSGEVGNNCYDHNLGKWRDQPGCWFEVQITRHRLWVLIGDRGQGVLSSLKQVDPRIRTDRDALRIAFEKRISARAPERRGNGLKFVRNTIETHKQAGVACASGNGQIQYGKLGEDCLKIIAKNFRGPKGTITLMSWEIR